MRSRSFTARAAGFEAPKTLDETSAIPGTTADAVPAVHVGRPAPSAVRGVSRKHPAPVATSQPPTVPVPFWRFTRMTWRDEKTPPVARRVVEEGLTDDDWKSPGRSVLAGPEPELLAPWRRLWPSLRDALGATRPGRDPDLAALVARWSRGECVTRIPRKTHRAWAERASLWIDRSERLMPFLCDQDMVRVHLERLFAKGNLDVHVLEGMATPPAGYQREVCVPVLVLGDLGAYGEAAITARWESVARDLRRTAGVSRRRDRDASVVERKRDGDASVVERNRPRRESALGSGGERRVGRRADARRPERRGVVVRRVARLGIRALSRLGRFRGAPTRPRRASARRPPTSPSRRLETPAVRRSDAPKRRETRPPHDVCAERSRSRGEGLDDRRREGRTAPRSFVGGTSDDFDGRPSPRLWNGGEGARQRGVGARRLDAPTVQRDMLAPPRTGSDAMKLGRHPLASGAPEAHAVAWGEDDLGVFMALSLKGVAYRMRWVPSGSFVMGSPQNEPGLRDDEGPLHRVTLTQGFWLGETTVTQALWAAVMGTDERTQGRSDLPMVGVSWDDCRRFVDAVNTRMQGAGLRLPTEAEWEYACRAGTIHATWAGANSAATLDRIAWYWENSDRQPQPVRGKAPNPLGLYDMLGNVWEWCSDWYGVYAAGAVSDPTGPATGASRVMRGASWSYPASLVRAGLRFALSPAYRYGDLGFRLARDQT